MSNLFRTKSILKELKAQSYVQRELLYQKYAEMISVRTPDSLALYGRKVYSQNDEDGIIEEIFRRLKIETPRFIEFGCGNGLENNTHYLAVKGSSGIWMDGSHDNIKLIRSWNACPPQPRNRIMVSESFVTQSNIVKLLSDLTDRLGPAPKDLCDFLSIDIDGNDVFIGQAIFEHFRPKVVCVEYNAIPTPGTSVTSAYADDFRWAGDDYGGASLSCLDQEFKKFGYSLVCCNIPGVNAFFVQQQFESLFPRYSLEQLYMPPRYRLLKMSELPWGHRRSPKYLAQHTELIFA